jgi:hypothetical protein
MWTSMLSRWLPVPNRQHWPRGPIPHTPTVGAPDGGRFFIVYGNDWTQIRFTGFDPYLTTTSPHE